MGLQATPWDLALIRDRLHEDQCSGPGHESGHQDVKRVITPEAENHFGIA